MQKGDFTVDEATRAQAQADIADDGYWGVSQIRPYSWILQSFLRQRSEKADLLLDAFKKGFKKATASPGGQDLPDISQRTYDAVVEKFQQVKNGTEADLGDCPDTGIIPH